MISSGVYGIVLSLFCIFGVPKFRQIFMDFKVDLPTITQIFLSLGTLIGQDFGWVILVPVSIAWPLLLITIPAPQQPESRRVIIRTARLIVTIIYLFTGILIVIAFFAPMISLIQSVSGPQKK